MVGDLLEDGLGALLGGAGGKLDQAVEDPLVFLGQEGRRQPYEEQRHDHDDGGVHGHHPAAAAQDAAHPRLIALAGVVEVAVEPAEETAVGGLVIGLGGLEQGGAEGRGQDQGDHHRQGHGRDDGDRELAVDDPLGAAEEGHGHEHGGQDQRDADQGAGDLVHRLAGGLLGTEPFLAHHPFDVLDHDDGVVDQQADGQHHAEHRQGVDGVTQRRQDPECAQQDHRDGDGGDQGGAPVLEEQEHHQEDQDDGLGQGLDHLLDGLLDEGGCVERDDVFDPRREGLRQLRHPRLHELGSVQGVGARGQLDRQAGGGKAVELGQGVVVLRPKLHPGYVAQMHDGAAGGVLQDDVLELFGGLKARLGGDGGVKRRAGQGRRAAQLSCRDLGVLGPDGGDDVGGRQGVAVQLVGVEPDAHGVLGAEELGVAHAWDAAQGVLEVGGDEVGEVGIAVAAVFGIETHHHQEIAGGLDHRQALLLDLLGQKGEGRLQLVLDLDLGDVDVGAGLEGYGDRGRARAVASRGHVEQAVDPLHLLLDDLGDAVFDGLGRGAGIDGLDGDLGQGDVGILGDGQGGDGQRTGHHDHDSHDPGEDRPVDEETRQHDRVLALGRGGNGFQGRAGPDLLQALHDHLLTGLESARDQPLVADGLGDGDDAGNRLGARSHHLHRGLALGVTADGRLGDQDASRGDPLAEVGADVEAGQQDVVGIWEQGAQAHRARARIDSDIGELQLAAERVGRAVVQDQADVGRPRRIEVALGQVALELDEVGGRLRDIDVDLAKVLHRGQGGGLIGRDQGAGGDRRLADPAGHRR